MRPVLLAFLALLALLSFDAVAATPRPGAPMYATMDAAKSACLSDLASLKAWAPTYGSGLVPDTSSPSTQQCTQSFTSGNATYGTYSAKLTCIVYMKTSSGAAFGAYRCDEAGANQNMNNASPTYYASSVCTAPNVWNPDKGTCDVPCSQRAAKRSAAVSPSLKSYNHCSTDGCAYNGSTDPADTAWHIETATGATCSYDNYTCPAGYEKGVGTSGGGSTICVPKPNDCPAGQKRYNGVCKPKPDECPVGKHVNDQGECETDRDTCPAGKTKGPDGSCVDDPKNACPAGQVKGPDGTCKKDADGDGKPDADDGSFGDSTNCNVPPQCSGDKIMCGQVLIQWRIECNTRRKGEVSGGICAGSPPVCTGEGCDAVEMAQLRQQYAAQCALQDLLKKSGNGSDGSQPEWTKVTGMGTDPSQGFAGLADAAIVQDREVGTSDVDSGGWLGGSGSCPAFVTGGGGEGMAGSFAAAIASPPAAFCSLIGTIRAALIAFASIGAVLYLAKGGS